MIAVEAQWSLVDPWFLVAVPIVWLLFVWRMVRSRAALPAATVAPLASLPKTMRARLWFSPVLLQAMDGGLFDRPVAPLDGSAEAIGAAIFGKWLLAIEVTSGWAASSTMSDRSAPVPQQDQQVEDADRPVAVKVCRASAAV